MSWFGKDGKLVALQRRLDGGDPEVRFEVGTQKLSIIHEIVCLFGFRYLAITGEASTFDT